MESDNLKVCTFNCKGHGKDRIDYIRTLMSQCDVLFLQEHWLLESEFSWFEQSVGGVSVYGVCAMSNDALLRGRPHGGCALLINKSLKSRIQPIIIGE